MIDGLQDGPKRPSRAPKRALREPQEGPKRAPRPLKEPQESPTRAPRGPLEAVLKALEGQLRSGPPLL